MVAIKSEEIYKLIDSVPDEKLSDLAKLIKDLIIPEEEPIDDEILAIKEACKDYKNGETISFTIDALRKEYLGGWVDSLELSKSSRRFLDKSDKVTRESIISVIHSLSKNPISYPGLIKLTGYKNTYKVRIGKYRIIYHIINEKLLIFIQDINSRGDIYKHL